MFNFTNPNQVPVLAIKTGANIDFSMAGVAVGDSNMVIEKKMRLYKFNQCLNASKVI